MKIRTILFILALLSFVSMSTGGYLYYTSLKKSALKEAHREATLLTKITAHYITSNLSEHQKSVKALAGLDELQQALEYKNTGTLNEVNAILDHFHQALNVSVCYLMDNKGTTIASSNRKAPHSFVGKNYSFRPYFQGAKQGAPSIYMALGVTSGKRGVYFSHPVYGKSSEIPLGVVVVKGSVETFEEEINQAHEGIMLLTNPNGVIFVTNHKNWLYHTLWKVTSEETKKIADSKQFGKGPWNWTGVEIRSNGVVADKSGVEYHIHQTEINNYPGWKIIYLHDLRSVIKRISDPLFKTAGFTIFIVCLFIGLAVFLLYREASRDIALRKKAEEERERIITELKQALDEVNTLRGILPLCSFCKKIRDDKGYWEQVDIYIHKHSQADISHSICPECMKQHYPEEYQSIFNDKE